METLTFNELPDVTVDGVVYEWDSINAANPDGSIVVTYQRVEVQR